VSELDDIKARLKEIGEAEFTWSDGFNSIFDLCNRAVAIAEKQAVDAEWAREGGTRIVEELRQARATVLALHDKLKATDACICHLDHGSDCNCNASYAIEEMLADTESYERFR
jgi:hypothetical protein